MEITEIETSYNFTGLNEGFADRIINGESYYVCCYAIASCGEAFFDESGHNFEEDSPEFEAYEELREASQSELQKHYTFDGSNWSRSVEKPSVGPTDERGDLEYKIVRSDFHGGSTIGYFETEEEAEAWIEYLDDGNTCTCGCYGIEKAQNAPSAEPSSDPEGMFFEVRTPDFGIPCGNCHKNGCVGGLFFESEMEAEAWAEYLCKKNNCDRFPDCVEFECKRLAV